MTDEQLRQICLTGVPGPRIPAMPLFVTALAERALDAECARLGVTRERFWSTNASAAVIAKRRLVSQLHPYLRAFAEVWGANQDTLRKLLLRGVA